MADSFFIEPLTTSEGIINAKIHAKDHVITLHSSQPLREAQKAVSKFNPALPWVLLAGFGLGYTVEYILNNTSFSVIVFEPDSPIFELASQIGRVKSILKDKRVTLIRNDISAITDFLENNLIRELNFYINRPYISLFPETFSSLDGIIAAYLSKKQINKSTLKRFQKVWVKNIIKNSSFYFKLPGILDIKHNFEKKPAVIVGAGPSLSLNIGVLEKYRDIPVIITTDTAYANLIEHDIQPDFIVSVDPQDKNSQYLLYASRKDAALVIDASASIQSFIKYNPEKIVLFDSCFPCYEELKRFWGDKGTLLCGGSVSTTAFDLARFLKCDPIIFIGQDLSYPKKQTHIKGSILEEFLYHKINRFHTFESYNSGTLILSDRIEIDGWNGEKVPTDRKFLTFLEWFKNEFKITNARIINSTQGGAIIKGADHMPLEDALKPFLTGIPFEKSLSYSPENRIADEKGFKELLSDIELKIENILAYAGRALSSSITAIQKIRNNEGIEKELKIMSLFDDIFRKSIHDSPLLARLVEFTMQESIDMVSRTGGEHENLEILNVWQSFYEEASDGLSYLFRIIKKRLGT